MEVGQRVLRKVVELPHPLLGRGRYVLHDRHPLLGRVGEPLHLAGELLHFAVDAPDHPLHGLPSLTRVGRYGPGEIVLDVRAQRHVLDSHHRLLFEERAVFFRGVRGIGEVLNDRDLVAEGQVLGLQGHDLLAGVDLRVLTGVAGLIRSEQSACPSG